MKVNGLVLSVEDCNQRFAGTFMRIAIKGAAPGVLYINRFSGNSVEISNKKEGMEVNTKDIQIVQEFPIMGAVNHQGDVHFLTRKVLRQWQRGLNSGLIRDECRTGKTNFGTRLGHDEAISCFDRAYMTPEEGIHLLRNSPMRSFAFNEHYWFSGKRKIYIWRNNTCLGEILGNKLFAFPAACIMKEELNEEFGGRYEIQ